MFLWCPFCRNPHLLSERFCPITGHAIGTTVTRKKSVEIGSLIQEKYLLQRRLGHGAFGVVYAAENIALGGQVALKFLGTQSPDAALRFQQEAKIANSLGHPNICRVYDSGATKGGTPFFVMELLQGETLRSRMSRGPVDVGEVVGMMSQVLSALGAAHAKDVIHRDIKPENIFLEERDGLDPLAKVLDFGLAKLAGSKAKLQTARGLALGTMTYMAPEQALGHGVSARSDLFACAIVLYEAIAGGHPFHGETDASIVARILKDTPKPLSAVRPSSPAALDELLSKALAKAPESRFGSAREFQAALHKVMGIVEPRPIPPRKAPTREGLPSLVDDDADPSSSSG
ncbi:MAG TPA: serine/threonine-protein kinase [Labilithrix sp.]|nr:serine/threonine-protein kinase [Labilithrix sp.]